MLEKTKKGPEIRVMHSTCFGPLILMYRMHYLDDILKDPKEKVVLVQNEYNIMLGVIYDTLLYEVTEELIEKTCGYDYTIKEHLHFT